MFRVTSRPAAEASHVTNMPTSQGPCDQQEKSQSRSTLRMLKNKLFSSKKITSDLSNRSSGNLSMLPSQTFRKKDNIFDTCSSPAEARVIPTEMSHQEEPSAKHLAGLRGSRSSMFLRRTSSKSKPQSPSQLYISEPFAAQDMPIQWIAAETLKDFDFMFPTDRNNRETLDTLQSEQLKSPLQPTINEPDIFPTFYAAATDLIDTSPTDPPKTRSQAVPQENYCEVQPRYPTIYVPTHVAVDFSRTAKLSTFESDDEDSIQDPDTDDTDDAYYIEPTTITPTSCEPESGSTDFAVFLAAARKADAKISKSRLDETFPSHISYVEGMRQLHNSTPPEPILSMPQQSVKSRTRSRSHAGSFIDKIGEYIKPSSIYSQSTAHRSFRDRDGRSSIDESVYTGRESSEIGWSRVLGSSPRSWSKDRKADNERVEGNRWNGVRPVKRTKIMPISPAMEKYNRNLHGHHH